MAQGMSGDDIAMSTHNRKLHAGTVLIAARRIVKVFGAGVGEVVALKDVDIELRTGELTLLMGPSGSGKTTLMSILGCIMSPSSGSLTLAGQCTDGLGPDQLAELRRRHVGFVFQSFNLFPTLTTLENVRLALDVRNAGGDPERQAAEAIATVGLDHRAYAYPGTLSGGEKQKVAIARALAGAPSLILADEPTAALDAENGRAVMALLAEVAKDTQRAVLAVTHDPRTMAFADRIVRIEDGLIVTEEDGKPPPPLTTQKTSSKSPPPKTTNPTRRSSRRKT